MTDETTLEIENEWKPTIVESHVTVANPFALIQHAIDKRVDVDQLEKLMGLQERSQANEARKSFMRSMAACQSEMPKVIKNCKNKQIDSTYANLESVNSSLMPVATKNGLSLSFSQGGEMVDGVAIPIKPGDFRTVLLLRHRDGYSETHFYDLPVDDAGIAGKVNKTPIHARASSTSYAERYLMCQVFSITIAGTDVDGNVESSLLNSEQIDILRAKMQDCENAGLPIREFSFIDWLSKEQRSPAKTFDEIRQSVFPKAVAALDKKLKEAMSKVRSV